MHLITYDAMISKIIKELRAVKNTSDIASNAYCYGLKRVEAQSSEIAIFET